jgi:hypothetical protein
MALCHSGPRAALGALRIAAVVAVVVVVVPPTARAQDRAGDPLGSILEGPRPTDAARAIEVAMLRVLRMLGRIQRTGRSDLARCMEAPTSELGATLRLASERADRARQAEARGDRDRYARERATVLRLAARARLLERAAFECIGPERERPADFTRVIVEYRDPGPARSLPRGARADAREPSASR